MAGPLAGVHVLDLARVLAGPYAAMLLGDLGAEVIKVERPGTGDDTRQWGPPFVQAADDGAESTYFLSVNRGKRSVAIDLKDPGEREFVEALVRWADVLVENFRPGVMDRLGLADDRLAELNPRLIRLSISGFGERGPDRDRVGYDQILQAEGGVMSLTGTRPARRSRSASRLRISAPRCSASSGCWAPWWRQTRRARCLDLLESDLRLGLEGDLLRIWPCGGGPDPSPNPQGDRADKPPEGWRHGWPATASPPPISYLAYPVDRNIGGLPRPMPPLLGKPVSSMIQASIGPLRSITGSTSSRTLSSMAASDHGALPTK